MNEFEIHYNCIDCLHEYDRKGCAECSKVIFTKWKSKKKCGNCKYMDKKLNEGMNACIIETNIVEDDGTWTTFVTPDKDACDKYNLKVASNPRPFK